MPKATPTLPPAYRRLLPLAALPLALFIMSCGGEGPGPEAPAGNVPSNDATSWGETGSTAPMKVDPALNDTLISLFDNENKETVSLANIAAGSAINDIIQVGSPIGYTLRTRYLTIGIPIAEALSRDHDPDLRDKLIQLARWDSDPEARAAALVTVARQHNLADLQIINESLVYLDPGVRFGGLEALIVFGHPREAEPLLAAAAQKDALPILRVYAAQGLARLGDPNGLQLLRQFLTDPSWVVRAMAARYLGDYGTAEDYDLLVSRISAEQDYDFVVAEDCIGALKLYPLKKAAQKQAQQVAEIYNKAHEAAPRGAIPDPMETPFQLEPLVITAPRIGMDETPVDPSINANLLRLLTSRMNARPNSQEQMDSSVQDLLQLSTLDGYNLKVRYTQIGYLLTEGLAGTTDYGLQTALQNVVQQGHNPQMQAAALVALGYTHDVQFIPLMQQAMTNSNITVRFGALEAMLVNGDPSVELMVGNMARTDPSLPIQIYAAAGMWRMGDIFGREILLRLYKSNDWLARAMATHYLGELGKGEEYAMLQLQFTNETVPAVQAELISSLLRLQRFQDSD